MLKNCLLLLLFVTVIYDGVVYSLNTSTALGSGTWLLSEVNEDSRGIKHRFKLNGSENEIACPRCKGTGNLKFNAGITLRNYFEIFGFATEDIELNLFYEALKEVVSFFYCKRSSTACVDFEDESDAVFQRKIIDFSDNFNNFIRPLIDISSNIVEVAVCEIFKNSCERFNSDNYNETASMNQVLYSLNIGDTRNIAPVLSEIIHNRVIKARCSLECRPFSIS